MSEIVDTLKVPYKKLPFEFRRHLLARDAQFFTLEQIIEIYIRRDELGLYCENPFNHLIRHKIIQKASGGKTLYSLGKN